MPTRMPRGLSDAILNSFVEFVAGLVIEYTDKKGSDHSLIKVTIIVCDTLGIHNIRFCIINKVSLNYTYKL